LRPFDRAGPEQGNVLILMPAAVLVLLVLATIALDAAVVFLGEREVADAAAAAANDAVGAGYDDQAYYKDGELCLSQAKVQQIAEASVHARADNTSVERVTAERGISDSGLPQVTVLVEGMVEMIFAPAIPGASSTKRVDATATAVLEQDPDDPEITVTQSC
jgi:Flp pilus assembly protein TadG